MSSKSNRQNWRLFRHLPLGVKQVVPLSTLAILVAGCRKEEKAADVPQPVPVVTEVVALNAQQQFDTLLPAGNYSGIAHLGGDLYALVDDKSATVGFRVVELHFDASGRIASLADSGFRSSGMNNADAEGVAFFTPASTLFIACEGDNSVREYRLDGSPTGRSLPTAGIFPANGNIGIESLTYNAETHRFWTTTEGTLSADGAASSPTNGLPRTLRLQAYDDDLMPSGQWIYRTDTPVTDTVDGTYVFGVSDLCALDDGRLLVMERESHIPSLAFGAFVTNKIYLVDPSSTSQGDTLDKRLLTSFRTLINDLTYANYEGICLGPRLPDGNRLLILVADSQNRYRGVLKDWFKTIVVQGI